MKRYNCTSSDKRGAFGLCMEEHKEGMFVPFSEAGQLKQRIQQLLEERSRTGMDIDRAILCGKVPEINGLKSRLELLANHHKREQELAKQLSYATRLLGESLDVNKAFGFLIENSNNPGRDKAMDILADHVAECDRFLSGEPAQQGGEPCATASLLSRLD